MWSKKQAEAIDRGEAPPPPRDLSQASSVDEWAVFDDTDDVVDLLQTLAQYNVCHRH